ncbi:hypothetical protein MOKP126_19900 [Mycobacterium avium subsp. hominissuis]
MRVAQVRADLGGRLQGGASPEAVADPGADDQRVVRLGDGCAVVAAPEYGAGGQVHPGERRLHRADAVQAPEPVERNPVIAGPVVRAGQPDPEFLAAHQGGFGGDPDDVGVPGQPDRRQDADVPEAGDDDTLAVHAVILPCVAGRR